MVTVARILSWFRLKCLKLKIELQSGKMIKLQEVENGKERTRETSTEYSRLREILSFRVGRPCHVR